MIMELYHRWEETVNKRLLKFRKNGVFVVPSLGGFLVLWKPWFAQLSTNKFQGLQSRIFPGQITVLKDYDLFNKSAFLTLTPFFSILLAKIRHGIIYDFYFISQGWSHYFILLSTTTLWKMTGYDLQLHLKYRKSI